MDAMLHVLTTWSLGEYAARTTTLREVRLPLPNYSELPAFEKTGERNAWGVFGAGDQLGTINLLTPERVLAASKLVRKGSVINLSLTLDFPTTLYHGETRSGYKHRMTTNRGGRDDVLDNFAMQGSSQWDGLRHVRYREFGYWGGRQDEDVDGKGELGMEKWAQHGIVGRGVLIDAVRYFEAQGRPLAPTQKTCINGADIEACAVAQNVALQDGDIILLRTGWLPWFRALSSDEQERLRGRLNPGEEGLDMPGLDPSAESAAWLWDHRIAAIAADNPALEALRVDAEVGFQHRRLIPLQGMAIGELWDLEALALDCSRDGVYEFMLVSAPLNVPGAVGSPANAYAIK
jgi:kynurenine formamidase